MLIGIYSFNYTSAYLNGHSSDYLEAGMLIFGTIVLISNFKILILHYTVINILIYKNYPIFIIVILVSSLSYFGCLWFVSSYTIFESYDFINRLLKAPNFYVGTILMLICTTCIDIAFNRNADF